KRRQLQQSLRLGGERERAVGQARVEERLLTEPVAYEHEPLAGAVPEADREHADEPSGKVEAPLLVRVRDEGRVAGAADLVPCGVELAAQLAEVVDLAVEHG